jgi:hypothetical protein
MSQYVYEINYTSPKIEGKRFCIHLLIIANSDEKCYELAVKSIEEKYLSKLDSANKKILSLGLIDIENLLKDDEIFQLSKSYLFNTIQHSRRYFTEESSVLKIEASE